MSSENFEDFLTNALKIKSRNRCKFIKTCIELRKNNTKSYEELHEEAIIFNNKLDLANSIVEVDNIV